MSYAVSHLITYIPTESHFGLRKISITTVFLFQCGISFRVLRRSAHTRAGFWGEPHFSIRPWSTITKQNFRRRARRSTGVPSTSHVTSSTFWQRLANRLSLPSAALLKGWWMPGTRLASTPQGEARWIFRTIRACVLVPNNSYITWATSRNNREMNSRERWKSGT